jgi:hypothetical protein
MRSTSSGAPQTAVTGTRRTAPDCAGLGAACAPREARQLSPDEGIADNGHALAACVVVDVCRSSRECHFRARWRDDGGQRVRKVHVAAGQIVERILHRGATRSTESVRRPSTRPRRSNVRPYT